MNLTFEEFIEQQEKYIKLANDKNCEHIGLKSSTPPCQVKDTTEYCIREQDNPITDTEKCILINTKKKTYYRNIYNPQSIIDKIKSNPHYEGVYMDSLKNTFETDID